MPTPRQAPRNERTDRDTRLELEGWRPGPTATGIVLVALAMAACHQSSSEVPPRAPAPEETVRRDAALTVLSRTGWTASASASGGTTPPSNAIDGGASTRWGTPSTQATNQWFQVNFGARRTFTELRLDGTAFPNDFPRNFMVAVSNDGTTWGAPVATGTGTGAVVTIAFAPQNAQYVRITLIQSFAATWSIGELNVYSAALSRTGWTATALSNTGSANNALDGSTASRWTSTTPQTNQTFQVDMKSAQTFNQIILDAGSTTSNNYPRGYAVAVSNDGTTWSSPVATGTGSSRFVIINFANQLAQHVRVTQTATNTTAWSIEEIEISGQPTTPTTQPRNGWTATAFSTNGTNVPNSALDGSTSTRWTSSGAQTAGWFQVDLGTLRTFNQLTLDAGTSSTEYPRGYQVQISNNGSAWSTVTSGTGTTALITINFAAVTAKLIKINQTATNSTPWSIQEMNISGQGFLRGGWVVTGTPTGGTDVAANAIDGTASTRWRTGVAQANGQSFQVDLGTAQTFNQLTLDAGSSVDEFPRGYAVSVSNDGVNWGTPVATGTGTTPLVTINFLTQTARHFRIVQTGTSTNFWSVHELNVWRIGAALRRRCDLRGAGSVPRRRNLRPEHRGLYEPERRHHPLQRRQRLHHRRDLPGGRLHRRERRHLFGRRPVSRRRRLRSGDRLPGSDEQGRQHGLQRRQRLHHGRDLPGGRLHRRERGHLPRRRPVPHGRCLRPRDGVPRVGE